jgi:hypothetical protein
MTDDVLRGIDGPRPLPAQLRSALEARLLSADEALAGVLREAEAPRALPPAAHAALQRRLVRRRALPTWVIGAAAAAVLVTGSVVALPSGPAGTPTAQPAAGSPVPSPATAVPAPASVGGGGIGAAPPVALPAVTPQPSPRPSAGAAVTSGGAVGSTSSGSSAGAPAAAGPPRGVTAMTPEEGPLAGGTRVTLTGHDLSRTVQVLFDGRAGTELVVESDTRISVITPAAPEPAHARVEVHLSTGEVYLGQSWFSYLAAPEVTAVDPPEGPVSGGNVVVVTGRHFTSRSAVAFGDSRASDVQLVSETELRVVAPAHLPGPVEVTVLTAGGTSNGAGYVYRP